MLHLCVSSRPVAIPLTNARYRLITDAVGDTEATMTLPPSDAAMLLGTSVGDEVVVWCTNLHRMIWRGQIEAMTTTADGTTELRCLGLWRLIGDLPITTVLNDQSTANWEVAPRQWITGTLVYPNPDRWETSKNQYLIATARQGETYDDNHQVMFVYRYPEPQRYTALAEHRLRVDITTMTGIVSTVEIGYLDNVTPPYIPAPLATVYAPGAYTVTVPANTQLAGWYIMTAIPFAVETQTGASRLIVRAEVNALLSTPALWNDLGAWIGATLGQTVRVRGYSVVASPAPRIAVGTPLRDVLTPWYQAGDQYTVAVERDTRTLTVDITPPRRCRFRLVSPPTVTFDRSTIPTHIYTRWRDSSSQQYATSVAAVDTINARKRYKRVRAALPVLTSSTDATAYLQALLADARTPRPNLHIALPHRPLSLATAAGAHVPSWTAEPGDELLIDAAWTIARIVGRVIGDDDVTYDVTVPDDRLSRLAQR